MLSPLPGVALMTGTALVAYGIATGRFKLRDAKGVLTLLAGAGAFLVARNQLPSPLGLEVGIALLVPSIGVFLHSTRRLRARAQERVAAEEAEMLARARDPENPALALLAEASIEDAHERRSRMQWRRLRMTLAMPVAMASVGIVRGDLTLAMFGAAVGLIPPLGAMIVSRFRIPVHERKHLEGTV